MIRLAALRADLTAVLQAGVARASASQALARALDDPAIAPILGVGPLHVIAAGKAAASMARAIVARPELDLAVVMAVGTHSDQPPAGPVEWHEAGHPYPDERSVAAATRALGIAGSVGRSGRLVLLLSGGASALLALPAPGLTLADKQEAVRRLMLSGADIHALNTVRKHLSAIKGGRLAAACDGVVLTLAISDVVGDDLTVIGSGPCVADPSTWADAARLLEPFANEPALAAVRALCGRGLAGDVPDTPKPGDARLARATAHVIGGRTDAVAGARDAAAARGYHVITIDEPVTGEARDVAAAWLAAGERRAAGIAGPVCVVSGGETTVHVTGTGRGGRNQELVLALVHELARRGRAIVAASIGTDGIDGPTPAAGAMADQTSLARATAAGLGEPIRYLDNNDAHAYFAALGDLVVTGRTDTNVGDLQAIVFDGPIEP